MSALFVLIPSATFASPRDTAATLLNDTSSVTVSGRHSSLTTQLRDAVRDNLASLELHTDVANLDMRHPAHFSYEGYHFVTIPILNEGMTQSNLTVTFDSSMAMTSYTEAHFVELSRNSGRVTVWNDGVLTNDKVSRSDGPAIQPLGFWSDFNSCLASAGIPAWLIAGLGFLCSATGPGFAACVIAAGIGSGTVGFCLGWASG